LRKSKPVRLNAGQARKKRQDETVERKKSLKSENSKRKPAWFA